MSQKRPRAVKFYVASSVVFIASVAAAWLLPVPELFKGLASVPGVGAMLNVVIQLWREERAHERALDLLRRQQDFALATASHMANVAYDKHVRFCEAHIERTNRGLAELMRSGPSKEALTFAGDLLGIRIDHAAWLTAEIESKLLPFEAALRKMGAAEHLLDSLSVGERRTRVVDEIYKAFGVIVGVQQPHTDDEAAIAAAQIVDHLRDILGIKELTQLRLNATRLALGRVSEGGVKR
jgi:hypothetical protein